MSANSNNHSNNETSNTQLRPMNYQHTDNLETAFDNLCSIIQVSNLSQADLAWLDIDLATMIDPFTTDIDVEPYMWFFQRGYSQLPAFLLQGVDAINTVTRVLIAFYNAGSSVFPRWINNEYDKVVIVDECNHDQLLGALTKSSTCYFAKQEWVEGTWRLVGANDYDLPAWDGLVGHFNILYVSTKSPNKLKAVVCKSPQDIALTHLVRVISSLSDEDKIAFAVGFGGLTRINDTTISLKPSGRTTYVRAEFDYAKLEIRTNKSFKLRGKAFLNGYGLLDGKTAMSLFAIELAGVTEYTVGQTTIDGKLAMLTQMEEEEDVYGQVYETVQELRTIRSNTVAILGAEFSRNFPYYRLNNKNNMNGVLNCVNWCKDNKVPFWTDKNANKRVVVGPALSALWVSMDYDNDVIRTLLDVSKVGKLLTRGWQAQCIAAGESHPLVDEAYKPHVWSGLVRNTDEGEIRIKGQMEDSLLCDGTLIFNGSGVGYTTTSFPSGIFKTLRGSFNYINLRNGETVDDVKAELSNMLEELLDSDRRIKASKDGYCVLKFRGRNILTYVGINQSAIISRKVGCTYDIQDSGTSATLNIKLTIFYYWNDTNVKVRGIGEKTMLKYSKSFSVEGASPSVVLGAECLKGTAAFFQGYCNWAYKTVIAQGGSEAEAFTMSSNNDVTSYNTPEIVDGLWTGNRVEINLADDDNQFMSWWKANRRTYKVRNLVAKDSFKYLLTARVGLENADIATALEHPSNCDINILAEEGQYYYVEETVRGVICPYVFQVELASVREVNSLDVSPTIQQISAIYAAYPALGLQVAQGAEELEDGVMGCVGMATNNPGAKLVCDEVGLNTSDAGVIKASKEVTPQLANILNYEAPVFAASRNMYPANHDPLLAFVDTGVAKKFLPKPMVNIVPITNIGDNHKYTLMGCIEGTGQNYSIKVGQVYNISSALTALLIRARHLRDVTAGKDKAANAKAVHDFRVIAEANFFGWMTSYENAILASYNTAGTDLLQVLLDARDINPANDVTYAENVVIPAILAVEGNININVEAVLVLLHAVRVSQAIGAWERYSFNPARGENDDRVRLLRKFNLSPSDIPTIALAGCLRRLGEGSFSRNTDYLTEDTDEGGESMWALLSREWDSIQEEIPYLLRRKLYKAMRAHEMLKEVTIDSSVNEFGESSNLTNRATRINGRVVFSGTEDADDIPYIPAEFGSVSCDTEAIAVQDLGKEEQARFSSDEVTFAELGGAFDVFEYSCPVAYTGTYPNCTACFVDTTRAWYYRVTSDGQVTFNKGMNQEDVYHDVSPVEGRTFRSPMYFWREVATPKAIIQKAACRYPNGVMIGSNDSSHAIEVYFDFNAILASGAFNSSGSTTGFALNVVNLLVNISKPFSERREKFEKQLRNILSGCQGQMRELVKKGLLKRIGRARTRSVSSKVLTSSSCPDTIVNGYNLPTIRLNPKDDMVTKGGIKHGMMAAVSRSPQINLLFGIVELSSDTPVGFIELDWVHWAKSNRGDGDGDGVVCIPLS